nr:hypothetical protein [Tanacetum cinerariifolium]
MPPKKITTPMTDAAIKQLIAQGVANALAEYEANRRSGNGDDSHDSRSGKRRTKHTTRECTYSDFLKCNPLTLRVKNKRKLDNNSSDNNIQQPHFKRQNVAKSYSAGPSKKKEYAETLPLCNKYKFYHNGMCTVKCANCKKTGHLTRDCRSPAATNNQRTLTCYECENQWHYKSDCLELKNQNHGNQPRNGKACGRGYALGGGETDLDPNNMEDDINS